ncbi:MAG: glycoside hydrolase, partial [Armatimonadota bacterium]
MRKLLRVAFVAVAPLIGGVACLGATSVRRADDACWTLENQTLEVALDAVRGTVSVTDKRIGYTWRPGETVPLATATLAVSHLSGSHAVDGQLDDWPASPLVQLTPEMTAHAKKVDGAADLSAQAWVAWDDEALWLAVRVTDEKREFATRSDERWWERDSIEFWVNRHQVGLALSPDDPAALLMGVGEMRAAKVVTLERSDGYVVEGRFPWDAFARAPRRRPGAQFRFALGVNDADDASGRQGQLYYPTTWVHSQPLTFAQATLADASGRVVRLAEAEPAAKMRNIVPAGDSLEMEVEVTTRDGRLIPAKVKITVPAEGADVIVDVDVPDRSQAYGALGVLPALTLDADEGFILAARYCDGILIETDDMEWRGRSFQTWSNLDMPWVGLTDLRKGYLLLADTPDDGIIRLDAARVGERDLLAPALYWADSKGQFRYPRRFMWSFVDRGGHVAICKRYREYAKGIGYLKTLAEKEKDKPQLALLAGAPDFWGVPGLAWCREAQGAGIDRALINGRWPREDTEAIKALGYLVGEYDNYVDIQDGPLSESNRAPLPESAALNADGKRARGWVTWDKKTTFMKLCAALAKKAASLEIPAVLEEHPYNARFLDVTTASGLRECYDEAHPLTRTEWRKANEALAEYVSSLGLVLGGEHGRWYGVPYYDYWEGMQSGFYSWPAGHVGVNIPQTREQIGEAYLKYGIGHYHRVPLWELCFHDCVVSTWYWGDSTGHLYNAAPEIADKKDAFNALYGTIPLYWVNRPYSFKWSDPDLRARLLQSYRNTCKLHEQVFGQEMLSHEFLTDDHAVQRTRFGNGIEVTVNFGDEPYTLTHAGKTYSLGANDFFAAGKDFLQYRAVEGGRKVTYIRAPRYVFCDPGGREHDFGTAVTSVPVTIRDGGKGVLLLNVGPCERAETVTIRPRGFMPGWDVKSARLYQLNARGQRVHELTIEKRAQQVVLRLQAGAYELLAGPALSLPDLALTREGVRLTAAPMGEGKTNVAIAVDVCNNGGAATTALLRVRLQTTDGPFELLSRKIKVGPGQSKHAVASRVASGFAGRYAARVTVADERGREELIALDNSVDVDVIFPADYERWRYRFEAIANAGGLARRDGLAVLRVDLARQFGSRGFDPNSVRVVDVTRGGVLPEGVVPSQFDQSEDGEGELLWLMPGDTPANAERRFLVVARDPVPDAPAGPMGELRWDDEAKAFESLVYRAIFKDGVIRELYSLRGKAPEKSIISNLGVSSRETGWVDEVGEVSQFEVLHKGPVRVVVRVKKSLRGGYEVTKTYCFYRDYFTVDVTSNKPLSAYSRAYYLRPCTFEDDEGNTALVDGEGNAEDVSGKNPDPKWYACYSDEWAHSCVAL